MSNYNLLYDLALTLVNMDYLWGGKNPPAMDCSGTVSYLLRAVGECPPGDHNAQSLFNWFSQPGNHIAQDPSLGALAFYGPDTKSINHVGMCLTRNLFIEAGGGGPTITSTAIAREKGAFVKVRPIYFGPMFRGIFLPEYHLLDV